MTHCFVLFSSPKAVPLNFHFIFNTDAYWPLCRIFLTKIFVQLLILMCNLCENPPLPTLQNKSAAGMQHTLPRDILNAKKIILKQGQ